MAELWGIHMPAEVGNAPIERSFISVGWPAMGDIFTLPDDREVFKKRLLKLIRTSNQEQFRSTQVRYTSLYTK